MISVNGQAPARCILIVDDDEVLREDISAYLLDRGFQVRAVAGVEAMDATLQEETVDLVILDIMLRGGNGLAVCRRLSQEGGPAVIVLTAMAEEADRVLGLEMGADDYLSKPHSSRELLARIRAVLRRLDETRTGPPRARKAYAFKGATVDVLQREIRGADAAPITLSTGEFSLLCAFLDNPKQILSRDELLDLARGGDAAVFNRAVDVQICRLRRKLRSCTGEGVIKTYRGVGYIFDADVTRP